MPGRTSLADMLSTPLTQALRAALASARDARTAEDLLFLERWELASSPGTADALRAAQLRRANPELAAAIRQELSSRGK
jgi:hypothetical protein